MSTIVENKLLCYHCGQPCEEEWYTENKSFCCYGCKTVYEILNSNDLCQYYDLEKNPGVTRRTAVEEKYEYLDEPEIRKKLLDFDSEKFSRVTFSLPAIHCVSCIWLLENLSKINASILRSEVNFSKKQVVIDFNPQDISLSHIAQILGSLGYAPSIHLDRIVRQTGKGSDKALLIKLAVAGFCFGNVMLLNFPEYLGIDHSEKYLLQVFSYLNILLSVPVLVFSGADYIISAYRSFKQRNINIDVPIAVGLVVLFGRSFFDIVSNTGAGYLDSFTGLVFFLLIGRWFQSKTYESLAFDRDFTSYFPLAIQRLVEDEWKATVIYNLKRGDIIKIRNMEIVPTDSILNDEQAFIDYSFVTGESRPVKVLKSDLVYAGGRLVGAPIVMTVEKETSQSHLTSLWNHTTFQKSDESKYKLLIDRAAKIFTWVVLVIALVTSVYWYLHDSSQMWLVLTSVLMVACPCALALAAPFTYGSVVRVFGRNGLYLKNANIVERMASVNAIVFDKTGTITHGGDPRIDFVGTLSECERKWIKAITSYSTHPLSALISKSIKTKDEIQVHRFKEFPGKGIEGVVDGNLIKVGSSLFTNSLRTSVQRGTVVFVSINRTVKGYFLIETSLRENIKQMLGRLLNYSIALVSGDNSKDERRVRDVFASDAQLLFEQSPHHKLQYIERLQRDGLTVMMLGDGLNDSGALKQSDVGIAVTDDAGIFTPSSDGIMQGNRIEQLNQFLKLAKVSTSIVKIAFAISFLYNIVALTFAITGYLTPLVAAILMPLSSISVVGFSSAAVELVSKRRFSM